ncbi:MAG: succinate dehydrogenase, hydrophobic membrane anchor protein [bacterium]
MSQKGTTHFVQQRVTAIIMIPLVIWFLYSLILHAGDNHQKFTSWIADNPWTAALPLSAIVLVGFYHMRLGIEVIIDDYIENPARRSMFQFLNTLCALVAGTIAFWSIVAITFIV